MKETSRWHLAAGRTRGLLPVALSAAAVGVTLALQNALFLTAAGMLYACELVTAVELFFSLCLLYFSLRAMVEKRWLFAAAFSPAPAFSAAVLAGVPFNALMLCTNALICLLWCASVLCMAVAIGRGRPRSHPAEAEVVLPGNAPALFSAREKEVIAQVLSGKTVRQAAQALFISEATVKTHLQHIYEKAGIRNRAQLALFMRQPNG